MYNKDTQEGESIVINTEEKKVKLWSEVIKEINWASIGLCCLAFFMGRVQVLDAYYTLGIGYLGSICFNKHIRNWSTLLFILGLLTRGRMDHVTVKYLCVVGLLIGSRAYMDLTRIRYNAKNQSILVGISLFIIGLVDLLSSNWTFYKIALNGVEALVGLGCVIVFSYSVDVIYKERRTPLIQKEMVSMTVLIGCLLGGLIDFYIQVPVIKMIYFRDILTFVIIIGVTYLGGMNSGVIVSLIVSTVLVLMGYMPAHFVAIYTFAALIGSLFSILDRIGVVMATLVGLFLGFALFNNASIDFQIVGAYCIAAIVSLIIPRNYLGIVEWFDYPGEVDEERHLVRVQSILTDKLSQFSKAYEKLGKTFEQISDKESQISIREMNRIIEETGESMCPSCSMKNFCWKDYLNKTYQSNYEMIQAVEAKGQLMTRDIPDSFKKSCIHWENFAYTLELKLDVLTQTKIWKKRMIEMRKLVGEQFDAVSVSIDRLAQNIEGEFYFNKEVEKEIKEALTIRGVRSKDIMVLENSKHKREIHIYTYYRAENNFKENVLEAVEEAIEMPVEFDKYEYHAEEKYCYFKVKPKKIYNIIAGAAVHAKGKISGDVYSFMELEDGKYLLALADGMGSGRLANEESTATIELLEDFMDSGFSNELAVKMVNSILILKSDVENFSTMDITLIDQYTGVAEFLKMGAATSFILRGEELITIKSNSLPVGILNKVDLESYKRQLKDGDVIIMVTDGMLESKKDPLGKEDTFKHFILEAKTTMPEYLASHLMQKTRDLLDGAEHDDMTIVVARVWKQY